MLDGATVVAKSGDYTLLKGEHPRFRTLVENQLSTGWLSPYSWLRAWPSSLTTKTSPVVQFTLSLPIGGSRRVHMQLDNQSFVVDSGSALRLTCRSRKWPFNLLLVSNDVAPDSLGRPVTVKLTHLTVASGPVQQSFTSLAEALRVLGRIRSWPVMGRDRISAGQGYVGAIRMRLDTSQLPKPFQMNAIASRDWTLTSDWHRWSISP